MLSSFDAGQSEISLHNNLVTTEQKIKKCWRGEGGGGGGVITSRKPNPCRVKRRKPVSYVSHLKSFLQCYRATRWIHMNFQTIKTNKVGRHLPCQHRGFILIIWLNRALRRNLIVFPLTKCSRFSKTGRAGDRVAMYAWITSWGPTDCVNLKKYFCFDFISANWI